MKSSTMTFRRASVVILRLPPRVELGFSVEVLKLTGAAGPPRHLISLQFEVFFKNISRPSSVSKMGLGQCINLYKFLGSLAI